MPTQTNGTKRRNMTETEAASSTPRIYQFCAGPSIVPVCARCTFRLYSLPFFYGHFIAATCTNTPHTSNISVVHVCASRCHRHYSEQPVLQGGVYFCSSTCILISYSLRRPAMLPILPALLVVHIHLWQAMSQAL